MLFLALSYVLNIVCNFLRLALVVTKFTISHNMWIYYIALSWLLLNEIKSNSSRNLYVTIWNSIQKWLQQTKDYMTVCLELETNKLLIISKKFCHRNPKIETRPIEINIYCIQNVILSNKIRVNHISLPAASRRKCEFVKIELYSEIQINSLAQGSDCIPWQLLLLRLMTYLLPNCLKPAFPISVKWQINIQRNGN